MLLPMLTLLQSFLISSDFEVLQLSLPRIVRQTSKLESGVLSNSILLKNMVVLSCATLSPSSDVHGNPTKLAEL